MESPSEDYDELTVDEVKERVESGELDSGDVLEYETAHKDRITLTRWLDSPDPEMSDGPEEIVVAPTKRRRVADFWVDPDELYQPREVLRTPQIEEAIEAGDLQVVER